MKHTPDYHKHPERSTGLNEVYRALHPIAEKLSFFLQKDECLHMEGVLHHSHTLRNTLELDAPETVNEAYLITKFGVILFSVFTGEKPLHRNELLL
jgi:hypothetical protein